MGGRRSAQGIHPTHLRELDQLLVALGRYYVSLRIRERRRIGRHRALRDGVVRDSDGVTRYATAANKM